MMLSIRQTAVAVGVLFLTVTVTFYIADMLIVGVLNNPNTLAGVSAYGNSLKTSAFLAFVVGIGAVSIAVLMYPLLKSSNQPLARDHLVHVRRGRHISWSSGNSCGRAGRPFRGGSSGWLFAKGFNTESIGNSVHKHTTAWTSE